MQTITSVQDCSSYFRCRPQVTPHNLFYGPIKLPDLNYFTRMLKKEDQDFFKEDLVRKWCPYEHNEDRNNIVSRCNEIFNNNKDVFLSGKGMEQHYIFIKYFHRCVVKKRLTDTIFLIIIRNKLDSLNHFPVQASRSYINTLIRDHDCVYKKYQPTKLTPFEVMSVIFDKILSGNCTIWVGLPMIFSYLIYKEVEKKKLL